MNIDSKIQRMGFQILETSAHKEKLVQLKVKPRRNGKKPIILVIIFYGNEINWTRIIKWAKHQKTTK